MTSDELVVELCDWYGFDNLYPYDDNEKILEAFKQHLDEVYDLRIKLVSKDRELNKAKKELAQLKGEK